MPLEGVTPLWIAARVLLKERGNEFFQRRNDVLRLFNSEDIHDLRVASRRLREGLALFAPCYAPAKITRLDKRIRGVTRLLGTIRNTDEALIFFAQLANELNDVCSDELFSLLELFAVARRKERKRLKVGLRECGHELKRGQYLRVINAPSLFKVQGTAIDPFVPLAEFAKRALDVRLKDVLALVPEARQAGAVEAQHLLRIAVKHFRYRLEILAILVGSHYQGIHGVLKRYQEVLGKMHDLDVFAGISRESGFSPLTEQRVLHEITARRRRFFADFSSMLETTQFERIGEEVRSSF